MKTIQETLKSQSGVVSLFTAVVLLVCITLVALFTSKTVLTETKMTAEDYRTSQAMAAADAAMSRALAYYEDGYADHNDNQIAEFAPQAGGPTLAQMPSETACAIPNNLPILDTVNNQPIPIYSAQTLASGNQSTINLFYFVNTPLYDHDNDGYAGATPVAGKTVGVVNPCDSAEGTAFNNNPVDKALVIAKGWSDDCAAVHTITQCITTVKIFPEKGPEQPFVTHGSIGIAGNATFINRYNNSNVWTGGALGSAGAAFATYLRPANVPYESLTRDQLSADCPNPCDPATASNNVRLISNTKAGYGVDVIGNDPTLGNKTPDETFDMFFGKTRDKVKAQAADEGQVYPGGTNLDGKSGTIWVDGNTNGIGVVGSPSESAILVVNGDLTLKGGDVIYGVIYVIGELKVAGNFKVFGSVVSESGKTSGNGNPTIVYVPMNGDKGFKEKPKPATLTGSWKDW